MTKILSPRLALLIIAAIFVVPLAVAWMMYSGTIDYNPVQTRNLGELVRPPVPVPMESLSPADPESAPFEDLQEHWVVMYALPRKCGQDCIEDVTALRQVHRASGKNQARIRLLLIGAEAGHGFHEIYPAYHVAAAAGDAFNHQLATIAREYGAAPESSLYLVDPLGNIMLFYAAGFDANDIKKDLKRLLTWSKLDDN